MIIYIKVLNIKYFILFYMLITILDLESIQLFLVQLDQIGFKNRINIKFKTMVCFVNVVFSYYDL